MDKQNLTDLAQNLSLADIAEMQKIAAEREAQIALANEVQKTTDTLVGLLQKPAADRTDAEKAQVEAMVLAYGKTVRAQTREKEGKGKPGPKKKDAAATTGTDNAPAPEGQQGGEQGQQG